MLERMRHHWTKQQHKKLEVISLVLPSKFITIRFAFIFFSSKINALSLAARVDGPFVLIFVGGSGWFRNWIAIVLCYCITLNTPSHANGIALIFFSNFKFSIIISLFSFKIRFWIRKHGIVRTKSKQLFKLKHIHKYTPSNKVDRQLQLQLQLPLYPLRYCCCCFPVIYSKANAKAHSQC